MRTEALSNTDCIRPVFVPLRVNDKPTFSKMSIDSKNLRCLPGTPCKRTQNFRPAVPNIVGCYTLRPFAHPVACCCVLLGVIAQSSKSVKLFSWQLPPFLFLFRDRRSLAQQPARYVMNRVNNTCLLF